MYATGEYEAVNQFKSLLAGEFTWSGFIELIFTYDQSTYLEKDTMRI